MSDLISKSALVDALTEQAKNTTEIAVNAKGKAREYYSGTANGLARASIMTNSAPTIDEQKIAVEYCKKRNLVMITAESFEVLKAHYNRINGF